ncbi:hypothetical protein ATHL_03652 [Anaerolinea thermolimosa]|uniref:FtsK domain-containing protein n=1 Tax=Anaerolinea thermolimosa TaxID=229919 RepID=A0A7U9PV26_9CHLR|nr:hypothetical protein [Anaerolinea thermolimosa]GAP08715.1 hypothetical protein ATHL_03623 [Anaerolinea thermolimosa]GAP08744.1 hypothetical protein ATHL_03652 [Anaerolinea thermolimosa]
MTELFSTPHAPHPLASLSAFAERRLRIPRLFQATAARKPVALSPELEALLKQLVGLPRETALLGVCEDGLPVLLDLNDPAPGSLLVCADNYDLRMGVLRTLLQSAMVLNSPRHVQFLVLSARPQEWQDWLPESENRHCLGVEDILEESGARWLLKLATWADQRRSLGRDGPSVLVVIDDLSAAARLEYEARVNFDWLVREGPAVKIWPVASAVAESLPGLGRWARLFQSAILGTALDGEVYRKCFQLGEEELALFTDAERMAVRIQDQWLKFRPLA